VNNFAKIILVQRFKKVNYYTLNINDDVLSLFGQFVKKHTVENKDKLNHIMAWIKIIGDSYSAKEVYFRNEAETAETTGLPPDNKKWEPTYVEYDEETGKDEISSNNLRLYTFRINEHVVFLFNGDIKTANKAQECDNVRPHFKFANEITNVLDKAIIEKDFKLNADCTDLEIDEDFELNW
jgi:hypothetical protein